jgi:hypothetical protein
LSTFAKESRGIVVKNSVVEKGERKAMNQWSKQLFWVLSACFLIGCAHSGDSPPAVSNQTAPPPALASASAPAPAVAMAPVEGAPAPSIVIPETTHDFGDLSEDKDYLHNFKIKNVGNAVLEIKKVLPG